MFSKDLDNSVKNWILQCASVGIFYDDLVGFASPKLRVDYLNSLLTDLHNTNQIVFTPDNFINLYPDDNTDGLLL
jgi:hypothetical protein